MTKFTYLTIFCLLLCFCACARKPQSTADLPRLLPQSYKISIAPFTQPLNPGQLITGQIPENQGQIPQDELLALDAELADALSKTKRHYAFIPRKNLYDELNIAHATTQPGALGRWLAYGRKHNCEYLLVPMVLDWHEREGSQAGVQKSAHCRVEFFLLNIQNGSLAGRSVFEEKQVGLIDNLLGLPEFVKRKGQWVSAGQLAQEGISLAVRELGL